MNVAINVAIVGSRGFLDLDAVVEYVNLLPAGTVVVSGGAPGPDRIAAMAARMRRLPVVEYLAEWRTPDGSIDRLAGFKRNRLIVDAADCVVAFWDGKSRGTAHTISLARQAGKPVEVITHVPGEP
jgi:predicted Rossmann fold nucleotide-binding protein DprA/Smf involved in DNA uptake